MRTMTEQTTTYSGDGELAQLREAVEQARRSKIAGEVLNEFLTERRNEILRDFELGTITAENAAAAIAELRVMKKFRDVARKMIQLGDMAEERMREIGG